MELSINTETKKILDNIDEIINNNLNKYYKEVLNFLNLLFSDNNESILQVKIKKITFNKDIFLKYNFIINKFKLKKKIIDINNFDVDDLNNINDIVKIMKIMVNNLLEKLNYKIKEIIIGEKKYFKIIR